MCAPVYAQNSDPLWNWYFVAFSAPGSGSEVMLRSGTARVVLGNETVRIEFTEEKLPELKATYVGTVTTTGIVKGGLNRFFMHEPEAWDGQYHRLGELPGCQSEEILLRPGVSDGAVLMIARVHGKCQ
jgi:hypothetical protein